MQNKKLILLIILGIAAVFSLIYGIVTPSKAKRELSNKSAGIKKQRAVTAEINIASNTKRPRRTDFSDWGRDPFSSGPSTAAPSTLSDMVLTGILWDDSAPLAMINDNLVGAGDKIGGYTAVEIKKDRVVLTDGEQNYTLTLPQY